MFLLNEWLQKPNFVGMFGLPYWAFLFVNNVVSVVLLSLILPPVSQQLGWWLRDHDGRGTLPAPCWSPPSMRCGSSSGSTRRGSEVRCEGRRGYLRTRRPAQSPASRGRLTQQSSTTMKLY